MKKAYIQIITILVLILNFFPVQAEDIRQHQRVAIDRVISAYGGEKLRNIKYLSFDSEWQLAWPGQAYDLSRINFVTDKKQQHFNFVDKKVSDEQWISQNGNVYHNRTVSLNDETFIVDYFTNQFLIDENQSFDSQFTTLSLYIDTYLAYAMVMSPQKFTFSGKGVVEGRPSEVLLYKYRENSKAMEIHIDPVTGFILDTMRVLSSGVVTRVIYERHTQKEGLVFAKENRVFSDSQLIYYSVRNDISTESIPNSIYTVDEGFKKQQISSDSSELKIQKIGNSTFHVGSEGNFSTFFLNEDYVIGVNTYGGLNKRIAEFQKINSMPLKYIVVSHHHSDHLAGINDAIDAGVTLIMTEVTKAYLSESAEYDLKETDIIVVKDELDLGEVKIFMINTNHAAENLVVYHMTDKTFYQDDHYNADSNGNATFINQTGLVLNQKLFALKLEIDWVLGGHSPKAESWLDFQKAVKGNYIGNVCPSKRLICINEVF